MLRKIIFFAIICMAYAAVYIDGPCPDVKPVDYVNITQFAGQTWYEIARYPNDLESKGNCATVSFQNINGDIIFTSADIVDGKVNKLSGKLEYAPNAGTSGILNYKAQGFQETEAVKNFPIYVVAVDENRYYIGYECMYNEKTNKGHVYAWIKSRTKTLDGDTKMSVDKFVQSAPYLDASLFYWDKFDDATCKYLA